MRKVVFLLVLFFCPVLFAISVEEKRYVENLIKSKTDKVLSIIRRKDLSEREKKKKIFEIARPLFDFKTMARLTLGKKNWNKLTPEQRKRFTDLFIKRLRMTYLDRVTIHGDEKVEYKPAVVKSEKRIYVPSVVISKGDRISVLYKFWKSPRGWRIYDVEVEGVSIVRTYRSQFLDILRKGTIDDLFRELERFTKKTEK